MAEGIRAKLDALVAQRPDLKFVQVSSTVDYVEETYADSIKILVEGALLAVAVVSAWYGGDRRRAPKALPAAPVAASP